MMSEMRYTATTIKANSSVYPWTVGRSRPRAANGRWRSSKSGTSEGGSLVGPRLLRTGERLIQTVWVGALLTIGYIVAPALFANLDSRDAGQLAGELAQAVLVALQLLLGRLAVVDVAGQRRADARAVLICSSSFCPSACQSPRRPSSSGRATTMRQSRPSRLTPISVN